jgi:tetratricopeptide (TPR) repeat protein/transcriptional regulator with XRE-family HTH domain
MAGAQGGDDARELFAARLTELLNASGLTQERAAAKVNQRSPAGRKVPPRVTGRLISSWKCGHHLPSRQTAMLLVRVLIDHMRNRGASPDSVSAGLLDEAAWRAWWRAADATPAVDGRPETRNVVGRPIGDAAPLALDVHPAIDVGDARLPTLPPYVRREHDEELRRLVASAGSSSAMAVLVGDSSTGKTRALWEAVQELPEDWLLWQPSTPTPPRALLDGLTTSAIGPRTVLWLDELKYYLGGPLGEQIAAALREFLHDFVRGPVLVLGTLWRKDLQRLRQVPSGWDDPHHEARRLLDPDRILPVPEHFSADEADRAAATADGRLTLASEASGGRITQFLAGVPALRRSYELAPATARAVLDAAIDIRRFGIGPDLPAALLEEAAFELLDDVTRSTLRPAWIAEALDCTSTPCRGVPGPLVPARPGAPRYRLSDIIEQEGSRARASLVPSRPSWEVFRRHADADGLARLGHEAHARGLFREASLCYAAAVRAGHRRAAWSLACMLEAAGRILEALRWYRWCAETGTDEDAYARVAWLTDLSGLDPEESIAWLRRQVEAGIDAGTTPSTQAALEALAYLLGDRRDELNAVLSRRYGVDDETELRHLGDRLAYAMDEPRPPEYWDDDEPHIGSRMNGPDPFTIWVGDALVREGRIEEALHHYRSRSDESAYAMRQAVELLERTGRTEEAISWLRRELMSGNERALWIMAELRARTGLRPEAMRLRTYGVETDGRTAGPWEAEPPGRLSS